MAKVNKVKMMTSEDKLAKLDEVFSPTAPIEKRDLFFMVDSDSWTTYTAL